MSYCRYFLFPILLQFLTSAVFSQPEPARVWEENRSLKTYAFSDPNPIPILTTNPKIYPYHKFEGYRQQGQEEQWKVVNLENDYISVSVLPEVGGKVWGAIDKKTGQEFIYRNEVMKFRNISMRGPWTSGGIEFNFGIIGHHPSTATPVDYVWHENEDGSVSCTVGNIDLPSRTQWRVTIRLPRDKACFETHALWYNPGPVQQAYYNWMTAAAPARPDFEFYTPGDHYLKHSGEARPWPVDAYGRDLSRYGENSFGPSKSYHVVGEYNDFFGGYYHDAGYGFGHWGEYDAIPGQKLWLWALSRSGGIWEDLLTDSDGQYIEFQAGRLFVQYAPGDHENPITQATFEPHATDRWKEVWFPVNRLGGLSEASEYGVMRIEESEETIRVSINAFQSVRAQVELRTGGMVKRKAELAVQPMDLFECTFPKPAQDTPYQVVVPALDLQYTSSRESKGIDRPFVTPTASYGVNSAEKAYRKGLENMKFRLFTEARKDFDRALQLEPGHLDARVNLAELYFRQGQYPLGLQEIKQALALDTYDAHANYVAGILYRALHENVKALEALGWAARSMQFRSAAYAQMAEVWLAEQSLQKAEAYARQSLDFNRYNLVAWQVLAITGRKRNQPALATEAIESLLEIDPLHHFANFEKYLNAPGPETLADFKRSHRSELAYQTFLELALDYQAKGQKAEALRVLDLAPVHPLARLWSGFLDQNRAEKVLAEVANSTTKMVFPFRRETLEVLHWACSQSNDWKFRYYLALNLWSKGREQEAGKIMGTIKTAIDDPVFFAARAHLLQKTGDIDPGPDLRKAHQFGQADWRHWQALIQYHLDHGEDLLATKLAADAHQHFPGNYSIGMLYAKALLSSQNPAKGLDILTGLAVLPFEGASEGRTLYEQANLELALQQMERGAFDAAGSHLLAAKEWPENLGVGKPFDPDERMADFLLAHCLEKTGKQEEAVIHYRKVAAFTRLNTHLASPLHVLGLFSMERAGGREQAMQLLDLLLKSAHAETPTTQWLAATFLGKEQQFRAMPHNSSELLPRILAFKP